MINLLFAGNYKVFDGILTCLLSILKRSKEDTYRVYILTMDLPRMNPSFLAINDEQVSVLQKTMKKYNSQNEVIKIDVKELYEQEFAYCPNESAYCSPYTLLRLLSDLIEEIPDKILYLDADIMFNKDVHLLYNTDIEDYEYAACNDHYGKYLVRYDYINAGVLLLNMKKIKETQLLKKARSLIKKEKLIFADQSAIYRNTLKKKMLPQKFNDQKFLHSHTVVRHFSKRLMYLPYPHLENIKQWNVERVHKVFKYHQFDDILNEYLLIKEESEVQKNEK